MKTTTSTQKEGHDSPFRNHYDEGAVDETVLNGRKSLLSVPPSPRVDDSKILPDPHSGKLNPPLPALRRRNHSQLQPVLQGAHQTHASPPPIARDPSQPQLSHVNPKPSIQPLHVQSAIPEKEQSVVRPPLPPLIRRRRVQPNTSQQPSFTEGRSRRLPSTTIGSSIDHADTLLTEQPMVPSAHSGNSQPRSNLASHVDIVESQEDSSVADKLRLKSRTPSRTLDPSTILKPSLPSMEANAGGEVSDSQPRLENRSEVETSAPTKSIIKSNQLSEHSSDKQPERSPRIPPHPSQRTESLGKRAREDDSQSTHLVDGPRAINVSKKAHTDAKGKRRSKAASSQTEVIELSESDSEVNSNRQDGQAKPPVAINPKDALLLASATSMDAIYALRRTNNLALQLREFAVLGRHVLGGFMDLQNMKPSQSESASSDETGEGHKSKQEGHPDDRDDSVGS